MGEDVTDMATTTSQLQAKLLALTGGKVDIMLDANTFKNSTAILREMSMAWEDMTDVQRASALELMGGKRQANVLSALIQNFDTVEDVIESSAGSAGSALRENEVFLDSFEGRMQQLTAATQSLWQNALDTDLIKDAIQLLTKLIESMSFEDSSLIDVVHGLVKALTWFVNIFENSNIAYTLIALFGARWAQKNGLFDAFIDLKKVSKDTVESLTDDIKKLDSEIASLTEKANKQSGKAQKNTLQQIDAKKLLKKQKEENLEAMKLTSKEQQEVAETFDVGAMQKKISGKKGAITRRTNELTKQGMTPEQIQSDPKIQQWNKDIQDGQKALDDYNNKVKETDASLNQTNSTTTKASSTTGTNTGVQKANAVANTENQGARQANAATTDAQTGEIVEQNGALDQNTGKLKKNTGALSGAGGKLKAFGKQMLQTATYMALIQGAMQILDGLADGVEWLWNKIIPKEKTFEELHDEFEEISDDLAEEQSELKSLEGKLEDVKSKIMDIEALGTLSFTSQEELNNLQKQSAELERQIEMQKILAKNKQRGANAAALNATNAYLKQSAETDKTLDEAAQASKEAGEKWGSFVDGLLMVGGAITMIATGWTGAGAVIGGGLMAAGMAGVGKAGLGALGEGIGEAEYKKQQTNQQAIDSYGTKRADYQKKLDDAYATGDADAYAKILEEYEKFETMMADNIGGLLEYISTVDYNTLSEDQKKQYEAYNRMVNQYNLANGGSITNAVDSILDYDRYEKTGYQFEQIQKQLKKGDISSEEAAHQMQTLIDESPSLRAEFDALKISVDDVIASYVDLGEAAQQDISLMSSLDKISAVTGAFDDLGGAIKEFREEGNVSTGTLESLNEKFGKFDEFEELYRVLATGEGDLESAVTNVANAYVGQVGALSDLTDDELAIMTSRLEALGVLNAEEVLMARQKGQAQLDALGLAYSIDLSNYGNAEQAKLAIAQAAGLNIADIADNQVEGLAKKYGVDLENYASVEEKKIAIAQARAKAESQADRHDLLKAYQSGDIDYAEYQSGLTDIDNSLNFISMSETIQGIIDNAYQGFEFNFDGRVGIGSDFEEDWDEDDDGIDDDAESEAQKGWEKLLAKYENQLALLSNERDLIQAEIDKAEARGGQASKKMYDDLIRLELEEKQLLKEKHDDLKQYLEDNKNNIDPDTWTEYNNEINATAVAIEECTSNIYDFAQSLREIDMHYFEQATDEISRLADEIDFVMGLFEDEEMSDEAGNWTEAGITKINLMRDQMTAYASLAKMWGDRLTELQGMQKGANGLYAFDEDTKNAIAADFQSMFDSGKIDKETYDEYMKQLNDAWSAGGFSEEIYNEWVNEAEDGMRDAISAQKDVRDEMLDMWDAYIDKIEEGIEKEIEAYEDLIDAQKEELDAARELHDFRKQVANDSKDIQELERRIASLSGSTAASDVAERRKLQAQLRDKQGELDDRYYDYAHDARSNALDDESDAFAEAKNRYVENMREAAKDTEWVINEMITNGIFNADVANDFLLRIQDTYNIPLSTELTTPWAAAAERAEEFKNKVGIIAGTDIPPYVTMISDDIRNKLATDDENNPWNQAIAMADKYADFLTNNEFSLDNKDMTTFEGQINSIINKWNDVKTAADNAYNAQNRTYNVGGNPNVGSGSGGEEPRGYVQKKYHTNASLDIGTAVLSSSGFGYSKSEAEKDALTEMSDHYYNYKKRHGANDDAIAGLWSRTKSKIKYDTKQYAKGTTGTPRDQWAITDEPQFGDELVLVPGKDGTLSFMRKGTGVVPADLTANLMEWGQFTPDALNLGGGVNVNMINNAVVKPQYDFSFDSLVHVDNCDQSTVKDLEKMVDNKINDFSKALNYSLKRFAR